MYLKSLKMRNTIGKFWNNDIYPLETDDSCVGNVLLCVRDELIAVK